MSRYVDLDERVTAQFYDEECEEWTMQTCTIADVLDSVCDEYTVLPPAQPEIVRCKDCKFAINADTDMMCGNPKSWVVATENDFGCILAERRTDDKTNKSSSC